MTEAVKQLKLADILNSRIATGQPFFSFEFFPPKTEDGVENLFDRLDRMAALGPAFCDITWGAGGSTAELTLDIATNMQNAAGVETMMHLTCTNMLPDKLEHALNEAKRVGLRNILALRGDPPKGQEKFEVIEGGFACALDLVKYIRKTHGDFFGIGVAGYPEAHPEKIVEDPVQMAANYQSDLLYLKSKIEAGGEVIVTQLFYDVELFIKFVSDCRALGINVPILPGIMPIMTYGGFKRMTDFCKTKVPKEVADMVESLKDNDEAMKNYGVDLAVSMCQRILDSGTAPGLHMYTLNVDKSSVAILERLGLINPAKLPRMMPWRTFATARRQDERVRPVYWANRPKSYLSRTLGWVNFPSARWANSAAPVVPASSMPATLKTHTTSARKREASLAAWGAQLASVEDVKAAFVKFVSGESALLPWVEPHLGGCSAQTKAIQAQLVALNKAGYLTINWQPQVNGVPSTNPTYGWGPEGGVVYQKGSVEFFASPEAWAALRARLPSTPSIAYMAVDAAGKLEGNQAPGVVNALTWGVFPGQEVVQPTVADAGSFQVWAAEAFSLWTSNWAELYEAGSASRQVLQGISSGCVLVHLVENDYVNGDLFSVGVFGAQ